MCLQQEQLMSTLTPRGIVAELDKFVVGQEQAKRMVAVAVRNRWRRQHLAPELRDEVSPKNIIMMGPTGVGKTEIARRLAKLSGAPFVKVEATKFTEVGYVGRDVESMVRDLMEIGINLVRDEENARVRKAAEAAAESRLMDLLLPSSFGSEERASTREKLLQQFRLGFLDDREVEVEVTEQGGGSVDIFAIPGMEQMGGQVKDMFSKAFPPKHSRRKMKVRNAFAVLVQEESGRLVDQEALVDKARERVEQTGIIFIDEIDKIASSSQNRTSDISREGVQRDLLPIVEGSAVNTKYGMIRTDHILFIAAGAFHFSKPSDMIPELQGRFPLRVELQPLGKEEFLRILKEPDNALTKQYEALLATEQIRLSFTDDGLEEIAAFAEDTNTRTENIGARRLYTIMEKILADISFDAPEMPGAQIVVNKTYVEDHLQDVRDDQDLSQYIL
jgi:ATP-dependent HslUV protease ATP-binding subunit HslU